MIDRNGTAIIIDFGSVRIAGVSESLLFDGPEPVPGTVQYTAPGISSGRDGLRTVRPVLAGRHHLPDDHRPAALWRRNGQGTHAAWRNAGRHIEPRHHPELAVPDWVDAALRRAVHPDPARRQETVSEFIADLRHPNPAYAKAGPIPLVERNPARFWQCVAALLACAVVWLLAHPLRP